VPSADSLPREKEVHAEAVAGFVAATSEHQHHSSSEDGEESFHIPHSIALVPLLAEQAHRLWGEIERDPVKHVGPRPECFQVVGVEAVRVDGW
jgi:hypothetical protein